MQYVHATNSVLSSFQPFIYIILDLKLVLPPNRIDPLTTPDRRGLQLQSGTWNGTLLYHFFLFHHVQFLFQVIIKVFCKTCYTLCSYKMTRFIKCWSNTDSRFCLTDCTDFLVIALAHTCVMLMSVSLEQPVRSSSCRPLIARNEAPSCSLKAPKSSSVTRHGFSSNGILGGWKKPMFPKVRVKLGSLSSCYVVKSYRLVPKLKLESNIHIIMISFTLYTVNSLHFEIWVFVKLIAGAITKACTAVKRLLKPQ